MIIGILEADVLDEEVIRLYGSYTERFAALLGAAESKLVFQTYNVTQLHYPEHIDACDAYLITGSKFSVYEDIDPSGFLSDRFHDFSYRVTVGDITGEVDRLSAQLVDRLDRILGGSQALEGIQLAPDLDGGEFFARFLAFLHPFGLQLFT